MDVVGNAAFVKAAEEAQRKSLTLLKNENKILPLQPGKMKIYVKNINATVAANYGTVVNNPAEADIAIIRLKTPYYPIKSNIPLAAMFHHGDLDFKGAEKDSILHLLKTVPTIVDIYLERAAVIPEINAAAKALIANYGASDAALLDIIFGKYKPQGHLPIELPSSMDAVRNQKEDVPYDSKRPIIQIWIWA